MELNKDFKEFIALLNEHEVDYMVVGAYSVAFHGYPRYTGDLDLWINPGKENTQKTIAAIEDFGFGSLDLTWEIFNEKDQVIQLGREPMRIDLMTNIDGVPSFQKAKEQCESVLIGEVSVPFIGLDDLIANKRKTSRLQDKADAEKLAKVKNKKSEGDKRRKN